MLGVYVKSPISRVVSTGVLTALAALAATSPLAAATERQPLPRVTLTKEAPVVISGRYFAARERIVLRVVIEKRVYRRTLTATRAGTFRAVFAQADASCFSYAVTATGSAGNRAQHTRRFTIPPPCGIAPQP